MIVVLCPSTVHPHYHPHTTWNCGVDTCYVITVHDIHTARWWSIGRVLGHADQWRALGVHAENWTPVFASRYAAVTALMLVRGEHPAAVMYHRQAPPAVCTFLNRS